MATVVWRSQREPRSSSSSGAPGPQLLERRLHEYEPDDEAGARFESAFTDASIGMALRDREGLWLEINDALCQITGYSRDELKATTLEAITHPDDVDLDSQSKRYLLLGRISSYQIELRYRHALGRHIWVMVTVSLARDEDQRPLYLISQVQDISDRKELAQRLEYLVEHDFLTGLCNRRRFEQELTRETHRGSRYGSSGALLLIDLDHFKEVNDAFGHKAGDDLLKGVAEALKFRMRQTDVLARVGGDEFAVLLPETGAEQAQIVAGGIVETLRRQLASAGDHPIRVTASVGIALFDRLDAGKLLACADLAMYEAKAGGRDRFATYSQADQPHGAVVRRARRGRLVMRWLHNQWRRKRDGWVERKRVIQKLFAKKGDELPNENARDVSNKQVTTAEVPSAKIP